MPLEPSAEAVTHLDESLTRIYHNKVGDGAAKGPLQKLLLLLSRIKRAIGRFVRNL